LTATTLTNGQATDNGRANSSRRCPCLMSKSSIFQDGVPEVLPIDDNVNNNVHYSSVIMVYIMHTNNNDLSGNNISSPLKNKISK
jgi:hypothetical protein